LRIPGSREAAKQIGQNCRSKPPTDAEQQVALPILHAQGTGTGMATQRRNQADGDHHGNRLPSNYFQ
jgi:hypothetical protein